MVMPDCSLLVTTFSRQSVPLQRIATKVISILASRLIPRPLDRNLPLQYVGREGGIVGLSAIICPDAFVLVVLNRGYGNIGSSRSQPTKLSKHTLVGRTLLLD